MLWTAVSAAIADRYPKAQSGSNCAIVVIETAENYRRWQVETEAGPQRASGAILGQADTLTSGTPALFQRRAHVMVLSALRRPAQW